MLSSELPNHKLPILTLHGPDGCGKSTIARQYFTDIQANYSDALLLGSSDFRKWLTADIYSSFFGNTDRLEAGTADNASSHSKTLLYEDIAVCLFGLAQRHVTSRGPVVVDSDPYLKRLVWAKMNDEDSFWSYADRFDAHVTDYIGDTFATHAVVVHATSEEAYGRIHERGAVSEYDPETPEDNDRIAKAVNFISEEFLGESRPYPRLISVDVMHVDNPQTSSDDLHVAMGGLVTTMKNFVGSI